MALSRILLSGCGALALTLGAAQAEPLKIALVETLSGAQASTGLLYRSAVRFELDKMNAAGGFRGEEIVLAEYDNQGGPVGAADRVKAAIADGARVIIQGSSSAVAGQISEDVRKHNIRNKGNEVLYINLGGEAMELTGEKCHFHHVRTSPNAAIRFQTVAKGMKELNLIGEKVYALNQNYSWGVDVENTVVANATTIGYEIAGKTLHEVNKIQDFSPYVAQIQQSGATTVFTGNWSNDLLLLMKAASGASLKATFATAFLDQPGNIGNAGAVAEGHLMSGPFNPEATPAAEALAQEYKAAVGHYPAYVETYTLFGMQALQAALKSLEAGEGELTANDLVLALEATQIETAIGPYRIRAEDHQAQMPMIIQQVSKDAKYKVDDTEFGFKPLLTYSGADAEDPVQASCEMKRPS